MSEPIPWSKIFDEMLITGWLTVPSHVLEDEIASALSAENVMETYMVRFNDELPQCFIDRMDKHHQYYAQLTDIDKKREVPFHVFSHLIITDVCRTQKKRGKAWILLASFVYGFMPIGLRVYGYGLGTFRLDGFELVFMALSAALS
jgi:hypothetical protein